MTAEYSPTLLLVDDNPDNLFVLQQVIGQELPACRVLTASGAREGLSLAGRHPLDGALLDMQMPEMDGIELCRRLKGGAETSTVPVILLTAHRSTSELRAQGLEAGADDFISRPIDNVELAARLKTMLRIKRAEDRLRSSNALLEAQVAEKTDFLRDYQKAVESSRDLIAVVSPRHTYQVVNSAYLEYYGQKRSEVLGRPVEEILGEELYAADIGPRLERCLGGETVQFEIARAFPGLGERHLQVTYSPLQGSDGKTEGAVAISRDVTARNEAERQLSGKARVLQNLADFENEISHLDLGRVASQAIVFVAERLRIPRVSIALQDGTRQALRIYDASSDLGEMPKGHLIPAGDTVLWEVIRERALRYRPDIAREEKIFAVDRKLLEAGLKSDFLLPLNVENRCLGTLNCGSTEVDGIPEDVRQLLVLMVPRLAQALLNAQLFSELRRERAFLQSVIDGVVDPIMVIGLDHDVLMMNRAARAMASASVGPGEGLKCHQVSHRSEHPCLLDEVRRTGEPARALHQHHVGDGERRIFELSASPLWNEDGTLKGIIEASREITDRLQVEEKLSENEKRLEYLAYHDPLTDLPNRLLFQDRLGQAMAKARRSTNQVALLFLDLDRFKNINDSLGHEIGDRLLQQVARRLQECVRETDTVARLGGDEFLVVLEEFEGLCPVAAVARRILRSLEQDIPVGNYQLYVTTSIGISLFPDHGQDVESLMKCADVAMYQAKDQGRDNFKFYSPDMNARSQELLLLEGDLRRALEQEQFELYYQPQVDLETGRIVGMEALLRWHHPERGMVSPADFIPLAEETGLIVPIGQWVLQRACTQNRAWQKGGNPPLRMAVNISGRQFKKPGFVALVDRVLEETGLDPRWLELEITESIVMKDVAATIGTLNDLKGRGVHLAIDDFGTGYSSLSYLKRFPISKLKIDRSFVRDITTDPDDAAIAASVIALAQSMNLEVVAEGVETEEQKRFLQERGCAMAQGFLFSRPLPAAAAADGFDRRF
ncbi:MAG: hypothetical protein C0617_09310 [Desulfuromonas sp.]|uniref:EAL domain-containing protein n=1 Tax=Desulfuromonas sp. TaxID=892 RepID=UPI000CBFF7A3|nr:EAL domain-containing protein [Desulfuromonas sp.]PLX84014.1 MAG: hypothetical protein C0617_09310 [Desulfuromonas sp.]